MPDQPPKKPMDERERLWLQKCIEAFRAEDYDALLKAAVELEDITSDPATASLYVAIAYYHKGMFAKARETFYAIHLMQLAKEKKTDPNVVFYLAMCDLYLGRVDGAILLLEKLEAKFPENVDYKIMLYLALYMKGDVEQGNLELAEAFAVDPKRAGESLQGLMLQALENSKLSTTSKVLVMQMLKRLITGKPG